MRIDFRPQTMIDNLVSEEVLNPKQVRRIIEIPKKNSQGRKVLDITYTRSDFMPTQWFVSNYNLYTTRKGLALKKAYASTQKNANRTRATVTEYGQNNFRSQLTINKNGEKVTKSKEYLF